MNYLITGVSKGIGFFLAQELAAAGHQVAGISRKAPEQTADFKFFVGDVSDELGIREVLKELKAVWEGIDVLINNAGIAAMNHSLLTPTDSFRKTVETNLTGTFIVSRECAKWMQKTGGGSIINMSTIAVPMALEGEAAYTASKAGIEQLTRTMARELSGYNIRVNCMGPCPVDTDLTRAVGRDKIQELVNRQIVKRLATGADVFNLVQFLSSQKSGMISGQTIYLGGF